MTTQQNINDAREASLRDQAAADSCTINRDAFAKFIDQVNAALWNSAMNPTPAQGPFTVAQAAMIDVVLPADYDYPTVFNNPDIWQKASDKLIELIAECDLKVAQAAKSKTTLVGLETEYAADLARAQEIANNDPSVIAAKENAAAAAINRQTELDKKKMDQQNVKMIVFCLAGFFIVVVLVAVVTRIK